jgi:flavin-dependent dehydrogenase
MNSQTIAIIGAGPAGCTLAALLAEAGISVVVFDDEKRPSLLVGESLVPAIIPYLRQLGIEDRVADISMKKPGVSFLHQEGLEMHFNFQTVAGVLPTYAYNVPRPGFDDLIRDRAKELGARFVKHRARIRASPSDPETELELDEEARAKAGLRDQPAFIVDATGRARLSARALGIGADAGPRRDQAHFAHYENFEHPFPEGQVAITYHSFGWSWRIPLPGCLSFGVVMCAEGTEKWGGSPEERLTRILAEDKRLEPLAAQARRTSDVFSYTNYQLTSRRGHGPGWVSLGDAFGFVDPMLSPGVFLAMEGAASLAKILTSPASKAPLRLQNQLANYESQTRQWLMAWHELIQYFYDGRIASFSVEGNEMKRKHPCRFSNFMERNMARRIACMASGATTRSTWSRRCLAQSIQWLTTPAQHDRYAVPNRSRIQGLTEGALSHHD